MSLSPVNWATLRQPRGLCYAHLSIHRGSVSQSVHPYIHPSMYTFSYHLCIQLFRTPFFSFSFFLFVFSVGFGGSSNNWRWSDTCEKKSNFAGPDARMPLNNGGMTMEDEIQIFKKTFIVIGKFLIPFGPWCVGDEELVVVWYIPIWKSRPSFAWQFLLLTRPASRPWQILSSGLTALQQQQHPRSTKELLFRVWTVQQNCFGTFKDSDQSAHHHRRPFLYVEICCLFSCLLLSKCLSVLGGHQTNRAAFFFNADKKISMMKKTTTTTVYGIEAVCGESDFWGWNRCWPVIDFS